SFPTRRSSDLVAPLFLGPLALGDTVVGLESPEGPPLRVLLHRPPARHNDLRSVSLRVDEFPFPTPSAEQLRIYFFKGCWEDCLHELVRDLADGLLPFPSVPFLGAAIPVRDDVARIAHEDRVVREVEEARLLAQDFE